MPADWIEAGGWLIEQKYSRLVEQRLREPDLLRHSGRKRTQTLVGDAREPEALDKLVDAPLEHASRTAEHRTDVAQESPCRRVFWQAVIVG